MEYPVTVRIPKWLYDEDVATGRMDVLKDRMSFERHDSPEVEVIIDGETILSENLPKDAVRV